MSLEEKMNEIFRRRSIRKYTQKLISDEDLRLILDAGMCAPSAGNEKPWHFIVVKNKENLAKLSNVHEYSLMIANCDTAIVVIGDTDLEAHKGMWVQDCSACIENMLLEATSLGIGSCWVGVHPVQKREDYIRNMYNLTQNFVPFAVVSLGYPEHEKEGGSRYDVSRVHFERW